MKLIDKYLPHFTFSETHSILVKAPPQKCYPALMQLDLSKIRVVKVLFQWRRLPAKAQKLIDFTNKMNFTLLEEKPYSEFIFGFGIHHQSVEPITDPQDFISQPSRWPIKVVWGFECSPTDVDQTRITTITRVQAYTTGNRIGFGLYWFAIRSFSGWIRRAMLKKLKRDLEG